MEYLKQQKIATELYSKFDFLGFNVEDTKEFERLERAERLLGDARKFLLREVSKIFRISTPSSSANHHASVSSSSATNTFKRNYYLQQQQQLLHYSTILGLKFSLISYPTRILRDEFNTAISFMVKVLNIVSLYTDIKLLNSIDWKGDKLLIEVSRTVDFGDGLSNDDNKSNSSKSGSGKTKRNKSMSLPLYLTDSNIPQFHRAISLLVYNILYVSFETGIDVSLQSCLEPLECLRQICIGNWGNERNFLMEEDKLADASAETNNRIFDISLKKVVRVLDRAREFTGEVDEFVIGDEGEDSDVVEIEEDGSEDADEWLVI
ncbi:hypothetical protein HK098_000462 [Nowakowskiella sp. JEL0407]|nr:hypothetical protein HK098_000462 [Nowakowskiella sp. JEL0407]